MVLRQPISSIQFREGVQFHRAGHIQRFSCECHPLFTEGQLWLNRECVQFTEIKLQPPIENRQNGRWFWPWFLEESYFADGIEYTAS